MIDKRVRLTWENMKARCTEGSAIRKRCPTYDGCFSSFSDVFDFEDWFNNQPNSRMISENGRSWEIDKDLCYDGNLEYSREKCVFIPHNVNAFFLSSGKTRGVLPQGVTFDKFANKYTSQIRYSGSQHKIGRFICKFEAHKSWQIKKLELGNKLISELFLCDKAYDFIKTRLHRLEIEINNNSVSEWGIK